MEASSSSWHLDDQMKKTTGDNLGVVGKNTEALLNEMAAKIFYQKKWESAECLYACNFFLLQQTEFLSGNKFPIMTLLHRMVSNSGAPSMECGQTHFLIIARLPNLDFMIIILPKLRQKLTRLQKSGIFNKLNLLRIFVFV